MVLKFENNMEAMEKKVRWMRNEIEKKGFIFKIPYGCRHSFFIAIKTKTQSSKERLGNFYITLHSLPAKTQREAYSGRFSGLRIVLLLAPSRPLTLRQAQGFGQWVWQVSSPITAAWPSPILTRFPFWP